MDWFRGKSPGHHRFPMKIMVLSQIFPCTNPLIVGIETKKNKGYEWKIAK
jgi:hypothetical protein